MNGIDAVALATGNDWRAIEAGAHAYAARDGRYRPLSRWERDERGDLVGRIELPMAAGTFGGATRAHPTAQLSLAILGVETSQELAQVLAAVGLAQNLAALRALVMEGIQRGHMRLHARQVAMAAGASAGQIDQVARRMVQEGAVRSDRALSDPGGAAAWLITTPATARARVMRPDAGVGDHRLWRVRPRAIGLPGRRGLAASGRRRTQVTARPWPARRGQRDHGHRGRRNAMARACIRAEDLRGRLGR